jgi:hypothetical protein
LTAVTSGVHDLTDAMFRSIKQQEHAYDLSTRADAEQVAA